MTPQLQRQLDTSIFSTATTAFATALAQGSSSTDAKRSTLLEAQALALLGLGKNAAADAAFAKALAEPQSVDHKAERSAWGVDDDTPEVTVAVGPAWRGRGLGTALLVRLLDEAPGGPGRASLSVDPENPAIHLYERLGFREVGREGTSVTMLRTRGGVGPEL